MAKKGNKKNKNKNKQSPQGQSSGQPPRETDRLIQQQSVSSSQGQSSASASQTSGVASSPSPNATVGRVQPEYMSLEAHKHIQNYLRSQGKTSLNQEDLNAVLRLSQHLRVFGLLSAVGYINQSNDQEGKVRERTVPVWSSLLGDLLRESIEPEKSLESHELMENVVTMSKNKSQQYLAKWRRSIVLANHWNFWARAYKEEE